MESLLHGRKPEDRRDSYLRVIAWSLGILAGLAVITAAKVAMPFVAPTVLAGLFALTLTPLVAWLERVGVPGTLAAAAVVLLVLFSFLGGGYALAPSAEEWRFRAPSVIRSIEVQVRNLEEEIKKQVGNGGRQERSPAADGEAGAEGEGTSATEAVIQSGQRLITDVVLSTPEILVGFLYIAFLCFFLLAERESLRRLALSVPTNWQTRLRLSRAMLDMRRNVGRYLFLITLINISLGICASVAFWMLELPSPALWGTLVAILNYMPYIGPLICNLIIYAVGVTAFQNYGEAIPPVLALVTLNMIEGQLVTPLAVGRQSRVGALAVFLALAFGAWLWGAIGALVATPLLIVGQSAWWRLAVRAPRRPLSARRAPTYLPPASGAG